MPEQNSQNNQDDDSILANVAKNVVGGVTSATFPYRATVNAVRNVFGLAPAPGEDNDAYPANHNSASASQGHD